MLEGSRAIEFGAVSVGDAGSAPADQVCLGELLDGDDLRMSGTARADDAIRGGSHEADRVSGGDVVGVDEFFSLGPAPEHGIARVARILYDRRDCGCLPPVSCAVSVLFGAVD